MRRKDREISDTREILEIIKKCEVMSLALFDNCYPYVVPVNFGAVTENGGIKLYIHCAGEGKKLDLLRLDGRAAFEMNCSRRLITGERDCDCGMKYESVCGNGIISEISGAEKITAISAIMKQYCPERVFELDEKAAASVTVLRLDVNEITGKRNV